MLKFALVIAVVCIGIYLWQRSRQRPGTTRQTPPGARGLPKAMTQCSRCGLHLPREEALVGRDGDYCSSHHRQLSEG